MSTTPGDFGTGLTRLEAAHKELEDSLIMMAHLERRQGQMSRGQAEYLEAHEIRLRQAEREAAEQRRLNAEVDKRIADLVSAIGAPISRRPQ